MTRVRNLRGLVGLPLIAGLITLWCSDAVDQRTFLALSLSVNQTTFAPGHTGILSLTVENTGIPLTVDFYFGALLPDGDTIVSFTESGFMFGSLSNPATLRPLKTGADLSSPFTEPRRLTYTWAGTEPPGNYIAFFTVVEAGVLPDNVINAGLLVGTTTFKFNPSSSQVGTTEASAVIGPGGGTVEVTNPSSPLFRTKIVIPPGALDSDIPITIRTLPALPPLAGGAKFGGPSIDFGPTGLVFKSPVSVTIPYADTDGDGIIDNTNVPEEFLPAYFHDDLNGLWVLSPNRITQDTVSKTVTLEVTHFTGWVPFFLCLRRADLETCVNPERLPQGNILYFVENDSSHLTDQENILARQAIGAAFESWNRSLTFFGINTRFVPTTDSNSADIFLKWLTVNEVLSELLFDPREFVFAETRPDRATGLGVTHGFLRTIYLNDRDDFWNLSGLSPTGVFPLDCGAGPGKREIVDLQAVVTHEIGHLFDLPDNKFRGSTMFHRIDPCDTSQRNIHGFDLESVKKRYNISSLPPCTFSISRTSQSFPASGGTGSVSVTAPSGCSWTARSNVSWITIISGGSGNGNGTVTYSVAAKSTTGSRTGTLTIAGQTFTVTQAGVCTFSISPTSASFPFDGGTGSVSVTAPAGCRWTARSNVSWVTITSGSSGNGNGTVIYSVESLHPPDVLGIFLNRTGTLTIAGQTFTITQLGDICISSVFPESASFPASGGDASVSVTAPSGCLWRAESHSWITIILGDSGNGDGTVIYSVAPNTSTSPRTGQISFGLFGPSLTVTQAGVASLPPTLPPGSGPTGREIVRFFLQESFNSSTGNFAGRVVIDVTLTRPGATVSAARTSGAFSGSATTAADSAGAARLFLTLEAHCHPATTPACPCSEGGFTVTVDGIHIATREASCV